MAINFEVSDIRRLIAKKGQVKVELALMVSVLHRSLSGFRATNSYETFLLLLCFGRMATRGQRTINCTRNNKGIGGLLTLKVTFRS